MKGNVSLMTPSQKTWSEARNRLVAAVTALGFPEELAELMARQLQSPRAIDRMTSFVLQVQPHTEELLVDEMLAICDQIDTWRRKRRAKKLRQNIMPCSSTAGTRLKKKIPSEPEWIFRRNLPSLRHIFSQECKHGTIVQFRIHIAGTTMPSSLNNQNLLFRRTGLIQWINHIR